MNVRRALSYALGTGMLTAALPAAAQSNPEFYPQQRWYVCHDEDEKQNEEPAPAPSPVAGLLPLPRKHAPSALEIAPLEVADVAVVEPLPARAPLPAALALAAPEKVVF